MKAVPWLHVCMYLCVCVTGLSDICFSFHVLSKGYVSSLSLYSWSFPWDPVSPLICVFPVPSYNLWQELDVRWMAVAQVTTRPDGMVGEGWMSRSRNSSGLRSENSDQAVSRWNYQSCGPGWLFPGLGVYKRWDQLHKFLSPVWNEMSGVLF